MDTQAKYKPYGENSWFADGRNMRQPPEGTIARGQLQADDHVYRGLVNGKPAHTFPPGMTINEAFVRRGKERYEIFCAICHDHTGGGNGMVGRRLTVRPPTLHTDYMRSLPVGHLFDVMTNGIRTMPSYAHQIPVNDRWAIAAYVQTLQLHHKSTHMNANETQPQSEAKP